MNNWEEILKIEVKEFNREELQSLVSLYQFINPEITQLSEDKKLLLDKKAEEILKNHRRKKYTKKIMLQGITIYEYPKSYMIFFDSSWTDLLLSEELAKLSYEQVNFYPDKNSRKHSTHTDIDEQRWKNIYSQITQLSKIILDKYTN